MALQRVSRLLPDVKKADVLQALKYIDSNGVPPGRQSRTYELVAPDGKTYPPKYVIAVADSLVHGGPVTVGMYNAVSAKNRLNKLLKDDGYFINIKTSFVMTITDSAVLSTDPDFDPDQLAKSSEVTFEALEVYYQDASGNIRRPSGMYQEANNMSLPRLTCQVFENQLETLSPTDKSSFPVSQHSPNGKIYTGIYYSEADFNKDYPNRREYLVYKCSNGKQFVIYSWYIFSDILFVQECLRRFGNSGDRFVLKYCKEVDSASATSVATAPTSTTNHNITYLNRYSPVLLNSKNMILRGAPGTGKTFLAKQIAADIISEGKCDRLDDSRFTADQLQQVEFVQFHPSYDYTDFVEGLRPTSNDDNSLGFELQDGIFKRFVDRARDNYENSQKDVRVLQKEQSAREIVNDFFEGINFGVDLFQTVNGTQFTITGVDDKHVYLSMPSNSIVKNLSISLDDIVRMLESDETFEKIKDVKNFFGKNFYSQAHSYDFAIYKRIKEKNISVTSTAVPEKLKKYVFIIDEINRGEISKIFGELFFAIDPGYRGEKGSVSTQYANLHRDPNKKFYIPDNVYIIGTMNDIDRSVETFDFAMRRRFRFIEITPDERVAMLDSLPVDIRQKAIVAMRALNKEIANIEDLGENYQIGPAYFLKLEHLTFDELWSDFLKPLLQDYVQGIYDDKNILERFEKAYRSYQNP